MGTTREAKDGTAVGEVRTPLDTTKLVPYLEKAIPGYAGPLSVKQFGVRACCGMADPSSDK